MINGQVAALHIEIKITTICSQLMTIQIKINSPKAAIKVLPIMERQHRAVIQRNKLNITMRAPGRPQPHPKWILMSQVNQKEIIIQISFSNRRTCCPKIYLLSRNRMFQKYQLWTFHRLWLSQSYLPSTLSIHLRKQF